MRAFVALCCCALGLSSPRLFGETPPPRQPSPWIDPFAPISPSAGEDSLVLLLITNEDPFLVDQLRRDLADRAEDDGEATTMNPPVWCADVLARSFRKSVLVRPDLLSRLKLQSIAAGLPKELTGGQLRNNPARAVLAICDGNYRLLEFAVGVPNTDELLTMIEDADEVLATFQSTTETTRSDRVRLIAERSQQRLSRLWRNVLDELLQAMDQDAGGVEIQADSDDAYTAALQLLNDSLGPAYDADVRLKFALDDVDDRRRLIILEQHLEARRPWCESMIPFIAGSDFQNTWRDLVETIWGHRPITSDADATELTDWFDLQADANSIVLSLEPPFSVRHLPWPPISENKVGTAWREAHDRALQHPFRTVTPQQLALLIRSRDLRPIDIHQPKLARYVLVEPGNRLPLVIRESDPPGKFATILKRTKSNLVPE